MRTKHLLPLAAITAVVMAGTLTTTVAAADSDEPTSGNVEVTAPIDNTEAVAHLFAWPWDSVASECTNVLGPAGFPAVEVSAPQEHIVLPDEDYPWWQDYQPVSYELETRRGSAEDFANMVAACDDAGVEVYADAVINHMTGGESTGDGSAGNEYEQYEYPGVPYGHDDFHHCGRNGNDDIEDWTDHWEVRNCELMDLADLATDTEYVQQQLIGYLQNLVDMGVDGFRVDAAKHMEVADLEAIYGGIDGDVKIFQEVIEGGEGEISPDEYAGLGRVTEFRYGEQVGAAFADGDLAGLQDFESGMGLESDVATSFIDNHDTQREGAPLTYKDGSRYHMAQAFNMAHGYGAPHILSGFEFDDFDAGPPSADDGMTTQAVDDSGDCADGWECSHRERTVLNMAAFRLAAGDAEVTDWWSNDGDQIAFGRGEAAYAAFNASDSELSTEFTTSLPEGEYCDVANNDFADGQCDGDSYQVDGDGTLTATVPADGVLAVHVEAMS